MAEPIKDASLPDYNTLASEAYVDALGEQISQLAANIDAATYRLLVMIEEFDREVGWRGGFHSCAHWLNYACGIALGAAREKVRVARALPELPAMAATLELGEISYSKVRALTRIATSENEAFLLEMARHATAAQMEKLVAQYRHVQHTETARLNPDALPEQSLKHYYDEDGMLVIQGRFTPEQGALLLKALEAGTESISEISAETPEELPMAERRARALVDIAESFLARGPAKRNGADRYQVLVHMSHQDLSPRLEPRGKISAETSRRLACDASLVPLSENEQDEALKIGRKTRKISPALRRALDHRDQGCAFPGCTRMHFLDAHHIRHWADGGETNLDNLISLCRTHHTLVHEGGYQIRRTRDRVEFIRSDGRVLSQSPPVRLANGELIDDPDLRERIKQRRVTRWDGQTADFGLIIGHLADKEFGPWRPSPRPRAE